MSTNSNLFNFLVTQNEVHIITIRTIAFIFLCRSRMKSFNSFHMLIPSIQIGRMNTCTIPISFSFFPSILYHFLSSSSLFTIALALLFVLLVRKTPRPPLSLSLSLSLSSSSRTNKKQDFSFVTILYTIICS
jgi:hypothetical protein